ncbi:MAG: hypothetical protein OEV20_05670, partial [Actinomycetota bacterium]|nr:hypothetical protein [Actinomycetota bacterium]
DPILLAAAERARREAPTPEPTRHTSPRKPADAPAVPAAPPAVSAPPPVAIAAKAPSPAAEPSRERAVVVPDFRGSQADRATALAAQEDLDVRVLGNAGGQVVAQEPRPGTIITGPARTVLLTFAANTTGGPAR